MFEKKVVFSYKRKTDWRPGREAPVTYNSCTSDREFQGQKIKGQSQKNRTVLKQEMWLNVGIWKSKLVP